MAKMNIRVDEDIKEKSERIFAELGINMSTAINIFLRQSIRENGIPFNLKIDEPNATTLAAMQEGKKLANDKNSKGYSDMDSLKAALAK